MRMRVCHQVPDGDHAERDHPEDAAGAAVRDASTRVRLVLYRCHLG